MGSDNTTSGNVKKAQEALSSFSSVPSSTEARPIGLTLEGKVVTATTEAFTFSPSTISFSSGPVLNIKFLPVKKKALITGVDGQDGYYLAKHLIENGYDVFGIVRSTNLKRSGSLPLKDKFAGDIRDTAFINYVLDKVRPDELYNLAALSQVGSSFLSPVVTNDTNYIGLLNILSSIVNLRLVDTVKLYQASTSEMFGSNYSLEEIDGVPSKVQNERTAFSPNSPYGLSKLAAHNAVDYFRRAYGLRASCGILYNHESALRGDSFVTKKITRFLGILKRFLDTGEASVFDGMEIEWKNPKEGEPKLMLGNLDSYRDWSHARDMVTAMPLLLSQSDEKLRTKEADYVVGSGETHSVRDFADLSFSVLSLKYSDYVIESESLKRPCEVPYLRADARKIKKELGWSATTTFEELVKEMVNYDVETYSGY